MLEGRDVAKLFDPDTRRVLRDMWQTLMRNQLLPGTAALVITKCEAHLSQQEFGEFAMNPMGFRPPRDLILPTELMKQFRGDAIFPVTVYGWKNGHPAQYIDGFGQHVPSSIEPAQVDRPFEYVLHGLR